MEKDLGEKGKQRGVFVMEGQRTTSGWGTKMGHMSKWQIIKVEGKPLVRMMCLISTGHVN